MTQIFAPQTPKKIEALAAYISNVVSQIITALSRPQCQFIDLQVLHNEPDKVVDGRVVIADGTDWDPGSGLGMYRYQTGTGWVKVG